MSGPGEPRQARASLVFGAGQRSLVMVGDRALLQYWHVLKPHFGAVLLPPHWRADDTGVHWNWDEVAAAQPPGADELADLRARLARSVRAFADAAVDKPPPHAQVHAAAAATVKNLVAAPDAIFAGFVTRTPRGLYLHSWGLPQALQVIYPYEDSAGHENDTSAAQGSSASAKNLEPTSPSRRRFAVFGFLGFAAIALLIGGGWWLWRDEPAPSVKVPGLVHGNAPAPFPKNPGPGTADRPAPAARTIEHLPAGAATTRLRADAKLPVILPSVRDADAMRSREVTPPAASSGLLGSSPVGAASSPGAGGIGPGPQSASRSPAGGPGGLGNSLPLATESTDGASAGKSENAPAAPAARPRLTPAEAAFAGLAAAATPAAPGARPAKSGVTAKRTDTGENTAARSPAEIPKPLAPESAEDGSPMSPVASSLESASPTAAPSQSLSDLETPPALTGEAPERATAPVSASALPPSATSSDVSGDNDAGASSTSGGDGPASAVAAGFDAPPVGPGDALAPVTAPSPALAPHSRLKGAGWETILLRDVVLPTRPRRIGEKEPLDDLRREAIAARSREMPADLRPEAARTGLAFRTMRATRWVIERKASSGVSPAASTTADAAGAEVSWAGRAVPVGAILALNDAADGRLLARVEFDDSGRASVSLAEGVRAWPWVALVASGRAEADALPRREWRVLRGGVASPAWRSSDGATGARGWRLDLVDAGDVPAPLALSLALVDDTTGWGLVTRLELNALR